jgi:hypothetical protein
MFTKSFRKKLYPKVFLFASFTYLFKRPHERNVFKCKVPVIRAFILFLYHQLDRACCADVFTRNLHILLFCITIAVIAVILHTLRKGFFEKFPGYFNAAV